VESPFDSVTKSVNKGNKKKARHDHCSLEMDDLQKQRPKGKRGVTGVHQEREKTKGEREKKK